MYFSDWLSNNYIEIFGAVTGILYVIFEIRQNLWLWPVGIITSAVYIWVFFTGKLYADMSLQGYYLVISILGWYWWVRGAGLRAQGSGQKKVSSPFEEPVPRQREGKGDVKDMSNNPSSDSNKLNVSRLTFKTGIILAIVFLILYFIMWFALDKLTDSPVPEWDSFITSLSIIATWMLARKIYEHWFLWIVVNIAASILFFTRALYPTVILYIVYCAMSFVGLIEWKKSLPGK
ncbi:MAG: nicotinamide riboside transporter PnuC [Bacteroidia bacterium]|jgi:nicotinamide mononucleotide transporter|nr:nicotinamide riboside transporter PnuC [Bacteroidia bacterium]